MRFSKSRYVAGLRCPKILWMNRRMPEQFDASARRERLIGEGAAVRELARGYYGECAEVPFDPSDFEGMAERTRELLDAGAPAICGATFIRDGLFCMADVLLAEGDGVRVVSVRASSSVKRFHLDGASYQLHVIEGCGLKVESVGLMHLNPGYRRAGEVNPRGLFVVEDITREARRLVASVPANLERIAREAGGDTEPSERIGRHCLRPYPCGYRAWCKRELPSPSIFDISGMGARSAARLAYGTGVVAMEGVAESGIALTRRQAVQVACEAEDREGIADPGAVRTFLGGLRFPLCFLDFETLCEAVPRFDGCGPWQQVPYQYSLHVLEEPDGELRHREFLAPEGADPRRAVAERLCADVPRGACTLAYFADFERARIRELAAELPDLAPRLTSIEAGVVDLYGPFKRGDVYLRAMGGSNSLKAVLPAMFPGDPGLDYHALEGIHDGGEAMEAYAGLAELPEVERPAVREQLLRYCELDTLAMVRIYEQLTEIAGQKGRVTGRVIRYLCRTCQSGTRLSGKKYSKLGAQ